MGLYLNPGNEGFSRIRKELYIDKSGLIDFINSRLEATRSMTCVSRPRRFGKSFAAKMLCAYYDKSCSSRQLFKDLAISKSPSFETYLNKFNVIYLDITRFMAGRTDLSDVVGEIQSSVIEELRQAFGDCIAPEEKVLQDAMFRVTEATGDKFFVIIDEWDALFRDGVEQSEVQKEYLWLLRGLFKGGPATDRTIAGAYMTGILPIKKYSTQSALTDFWEYTMVDPGRLAEYIGFTESEVRGLCERYHGDFDEMERWYDGYSFSGAPHIYSPNSVIHAIEMGKCKNYWTQSSSFTVLSHYITMNMDGLKDSVIAMLGGQSAPVDTLSFQNDMVNLRNRDDVLTLLIHLGYLAYDEQSEEARIPNLEVADSLRLAVQETDWKGVNEALRESKALLQSTIAGDCAAVARALERIHDDSCSVLQYNNENSLSCALTIAYYTARSDYTIVRELPTGKGFADLVFIPHKRSSKPAMIVELKYDKSADSAIAQIKEKRYGGKLKNHAHRVLLVAVSYDRESKKHSCVIEEMAL